MQHTIISYVMICRIRFGLFGLVIPRSQQAVDLGLGTPPRCKLRNFECVRTDRASMLVES